MRFQIELEFVQCLANPNYLNCEYRAFKVFDHIIAIYL